MSARLASCTAAAVLIALSQSPTRWQSATQHPPPGGPAEPLLGSGAALCHLLGVGELGIRLDLAAYLLIVALAGVATAAAHALFRGPGRWPAAVAGGLVTAIASLRWLQSAGPWLLVQSVPPTLAAVAAVAIVLRATLHEGGVHPRARTLGLAASALATLLSPRVGAPLMVMLAIVCWVHAPAASRGQGPRSWAGSVLVVGLPTLAAAVGLAVVGVRWMPVDLGAIHLRWPDSTGQLHLPAFAIYSGLSLLVLTALPLRQRGGPFVLLATAAALTVHETDGPLVPVSIVLVLLSTATAGWIWLCGARLHHARAWTSVATMAVIAVAVVPGAQAVISDGRPVATRRPTRGVLRVLERGLVAPGDAVVAYGPWRSDIAFAQWAEGFRPDVAWLDGRASPPGEQLSAMMRWDDAGRRILSDRLDGGQGWDPHAVVDSGPLFWLAGRGADDEREFTDLTRFEPTWEDLDALEAQRWALILLERARFRRALAEPDAAIETLALGSKRRQALVTRLQLSRRAGPTSAQRSESPRLDSDARWDPHARFIVEAADIMYAHGEHGRAAELFAEASILDEGIGALASLARWQLRAGEAAASDETLRHLASRPALRPQLLSLLEWCLWRGRWEEARTIARSLPPHPDLAPRELASRLQLLAGTAFEGAPSGMPIGTPSDAAAVTRRRDRAPAPPSP